jgi:MinD-like ATPase involved in chromosome partitioning or flagellar assembly
MREPAVALAFTPDPWVEGLHRHLSDHGGARVRSLVLEPAVALEESYDVLIAGHRWPALTRAFVDDVHARGRAVLGVFDSEESASRAHLLSIGVDAIVESDAAPATFVRAIAATAGNSRRAAEAPAPPVPERTGRLVVVGGAPGAGRTEVAIQLAIACRARAALLDADDVAPAVAQRLSLAIEPNLTTAIDAVEHGRGDVADACQAERSSGLTVLCGVAHSRAWLQVRPGEVVRVVEHLAAAHELVIADGVGSLEEVGAGPGRGRYATARALVAEADAIVAVCDAAPTGISRLLAWIVEARALAADVPAVVVVNRAPKVRFRRGELYDEIMASVPAVDVVFVAADRRVSDAAWRGEPVGVGPFTRALQSLAAIVAEVPRRPGPVVELDAAS